MYNTYGFKFDNLDRLAEILADVLQIRWEARENSFSGEYYDVGYPPDEMLRLENNYFELEGWSMQDFQDYALILYVNRTTPQKQEALEQLFRETLDMEWKLIETRE